MVEHSTKQQRAAQHRAAQHSTAHLHSRPFTVPNQPLIPTTCIY
jgi:hypothetical protein